MLGKLLNKRKKDPFIGLTYKDKPGFLIPSVDDVRFQALEFEKLVKNYIENKTGKPPTCKLHNLIHNILPNHPLYPDQVTHWLIFMEEAKKLKDFRNNIVHSDFDSLPSVSEVFYRFKKANETLLPFKICSASSERFKFIRWDSDALEIKIDNRLYRLEPEDLINLTIELHPSSRGKVHFIKGRVVEGKMLDYYYEKITYFIEGYPEFELNHDESMVLEDLLLGLIGRYKHGD